MKPPKPFIAKFENKISVLLGFNFSCTKMLLQPTYLPDFAPQKCKIFKQLSIVMALWMHVLKNVFKYTYIQLFKNYS